VFTGIALNADGEAIDGNLAALARLLERCTALGFDGIEISTGCCNVIRGGRVATSELVRVQDLLTQYPLRYTLHAPVNLNLLRKPDVAMEVLESCLVMAAGFGAEVVVYHSAQIALLGGLVGLAPLPDAGELKEMWQRETAALRHFARRTEELGVVLVVENRDPHLWEVGVLARNGRACTELVHYHQGMCLDLLARQVAQIDSPYLGLCLDVGHAFLAAPYWEEPDFLSAVRWAAPWVKHLHLHDNFGRLDDLSQTLHDRLAFGEADNHLPPGWGCIPLREVLGTMATAGYEGWIVAEVCPRYEPYYEEVLANVGALLPRG
jgi:sugar phosphate isomerase/epimerase